MSLLWLLVVVAPLLSEAACPEYYWSANIQLLCYGKPIVAATVIPLGYIDGPHDVYNTTDIEGRAFISAVYRMDDGYCHYLPEAHIDVYRAPCQQGWMDLRQFLFPDKQPQKGQTPLYDFVWDFSKDLGNGHWNGTHAVGKRDRHE